MITPEAISEALHSKDYAAQMLDITILPHGNHAARLQMQVQKNMLNGHGICHGGILFSLADTAFAHGCNRQNSATVATAASIEFVKAAHLNDVLTAVVTEKTQGRKSGVYDVTIENQSNELVALFRGRSLATGNPVISE